MSKTPIVRPISWLNASISVGVLALLCSIGFFLGGSAGVMFAALFYVILSQLLRRTIPINHRKAISYVKNCDFQNAIREFERSEQFFTDNAWVDRFRSLTMLSSAGMSYREMAMTSLAFCHAQVGDGKTAREYYTRCIDEYPDNEMARTALRLMDAGAAQS